VKAFTALYRALDQSNATRDKLSALQQYFESAPAADAAWALHVLAGGPMRRVVKTRLLREAVLRATGLSQWLFEECYATVGDLAETVALLLGDVGQSYDPDLRAERGLDVWMRERLLPIAALDEAAAIEALQRCWAVLDAEERFVFNKLITGGLRVGVSRQTVLKALAVLNTLEAGVIAQRMVGFVARKGLPDARAFTALCAPLGASPDQTDDEQALSGLLPYPFQLAHGWTEDDAQALDAADCRVEWKWDGIRAQLIREGEQVALWSRGEELITDRFPEIAAAARDTLAPGCTLDGEILIWRAGEPQPSPFSVLQTRITRKRPGARTLAEAPACFLAFDCLRAHYTDVRNQPLDARVRQLEQLAHALPEEGPIRVMSAPALSDWTAVDQLRTDARHRGAEGVMIKHRQARYVAGRARAPDRTQWWKWKLDPRTVDAVLIYAQAGHGRRANLYTDYTFALWDVREGERRLVPFAKAYSGLTDAEIRAVDAIIRRNTIERFGPVRSVTPCLVFEIAFEGIQVSKRHRAGVAVRFPRILRWRTDKQPDEADRLERLLEWLQPAER
jgi:DNA ligase-1